MDIEFWRDKIDAIDERLVELLNERSRCAVEIGKLKRRLQLQLYQPDREKAVLHHVQRVNHGPLDPGAINRLFERIIDESRRVERIALEGQDEDTKNQQGRES
jgi:chorismate mutase